MTASIWDPCLPDASAAVDAVICASVKSYGAIGDGIEDDTAAIQACIDANNCVFFPAGTYLVTNLDLKANLVITGVGAGGAILKQSSATGLKGLFFVDSGSPSATVDNIEIKNITVQGRSVEDGFWEFYHLITLHGVRNVYIHHCIIKGFQGDGIYIGASASAGVERHNYDIDISQNYFDGVNKENRNGVTVIDGQNVKIHHNTFTRCTKSTMPGPIDIEPDNYAFHYIKDINISDNYFVDNGGNVACIGIVGGSAVARPTSIIIHGNQFRDSNTGAAHAEIAIVFTGVQVTNADAPQGILITDNTGILGSKPFEIRGVKGVKVSGNYFSQYVSDGVIGFSADEDYVHDASFVNNTFHKCGTVANQALSIFKAQRLTFKNNLFDDFGIGDTTSSAILLTDSGVTRSLHFRDNIYRHPHNAIMYTVRKAVGHVTAEETNIGYSNNSYGPTPAYNCSSDLISEEGNNAMITFTPKASGANFAGSLTYNSQEGYYRRDGNVCHFIILCGWTSKGGADGVLNLKLPKNAFIRLSNPITPCGYCIVSGAMGFTLGTKSLVPYIQDQQIVDGVRGAVRIAITDGGLAPSSLVIADNMHVWIEGRYLIDYTMGLE